MSKSALTTSQLAAARSHLFRKMEVEDTLLCNLTKCIRCGKNHKRLTFKPFQKTPPSEFTHWALCPHTKEPVLLASVMSDDPRLQSRKALGMTTVLAKS
jgi:hypothetical protein